MDDKGKLIAERCWHALFLHAWHIFCCVTWLLKCKKKEKEISFCAEIKEKAGA